MRKLAAAILLAAFSVPALAGNMACWGDNSRDDITCIQLTEKLLLSLRGQPIAAVMKVMKAPGVERAPNRLHFLSNYAKGGATGSGSLDVTFDGGQVVIVSASVDTPSRIGALGFLWSAYAAPEFGNEIDKSTMDLRRLPYCSDFSGTPDMCRTRTTEGELGRAQMEFSMTRRELLEMLEGSCHIEGMQVLDPRGDCARLKRKLR